MVAVIVLVALVWWLLADEQRPAPPAAVSVAPPAPAPSAPPVDERYTLGGTGGPLGNPVALESVHGRHRLIAAPSMICRPGMEKGPA